MARRLLSSVASVVVLKKALISLLHGREKKSDASLSCGLLRTHPSLSPLRSAALLSLALFIFCLSGWVDASMDGAYASVGRVASSGGNLFSRSPYQSVSRGNPLLLRFLPATPGVRTREPRIDRCSYRAQVYVHLRYGAETYVSIYSCACVGLGGTGKLSRHCSFLPLGLT